MSLKAQSFVIIISLNVLSLLVLLLLSCIPISWVHFMSCQDDTSASLRMLCERLNHIFGKMLRPLKHSGLL